MDYVYFNLHTKRFSVMNRGKVRNSNAEFLCISDADFVVRPAGRERVLREGRKNVHAFVRGSAVEVDRDGFSDLDAPVQISYNPYKGNTFYRVDTGEPVYHAEQVFAEAKDGRATLWAWL